MAAEQRLVVGLVRGVRGLQGTVRVEVLTDHPEERFRAGAIVHPEGTDRTLAIAEATPVADGPGWWLRFERVRDRTAAERLVGTYLEASVDAPTREASDAAAPVWWHEVIGAEVRDRSGTLLGRVTDVYRAGGAEVYAVDGGPPGPFDLPAVSAVISDFSPRDGRLVVDTEALGLDMERPRRRPRGRRSSKAPIDGAPGTTAD